MTIPATEGTAMAAAAVIRYPDASCPPGGSRIHQAGTKYTTAYLKSGASCTAVAPSPLAVYYALGAEVPPSTFQSATAAVE